MSSRIYLSFWHLCLDNLPQGRFERRTIEASDARAMINAARTDKTLLCVSKDDLLAPYRTKERRRHEKLCALLSASYDCHLSLKDFLTEVDDEENPLQTIVPLQVVELQPGDRFLIVTCDYRLAGKTEDKIDFEDRFFLAADSVGFHLISALLPQDVAASA